MFFRGILAKILTLLFLFNIAIWAFIFFTDDASLVEIGHKRDQLYQRSVLYSKLVEPVFENNDLSRFSRKLAIREIFSDPLLIGTDYVVLTKVNAPEESDVEYTYNALEENDGEYTYFDGQNREATPSVTMTYLPDDAAKKFIPKPRWFDPFEALFVFYKSIFDFEIVTEPYVADRAKSTRQFQILNSISDRYDLSYLAPIKINRKTVAILNVSDQYYLREAYLNKNQSRLNLLAGLSLIILIFGFIIAFSIALPIRRLSRQLNKKLKANTVVDQLESFQINRFENRKDEVGLLYRNLGGLHQQIIKLFHEKERFAADVSHELKNPIAAIIANTENAISEGPSAPNQSDAFVAIKSQAVRMNKLISEIAEAAIVDNDLVTAEREKFDLSETAQDIVDFLTTQNDGNNVVLTSRIQKNIKFTGLPDRIARVIINLLENAISFAGDNGEVRITIKKSWRQNITITVEDSGPGVSEAIKEDIFERFFSSRDDSTSRDTNSGLGLYICQQVVDAHKGEIEVSDSKSLGGASFLVKFHK